MANPIQKTPFLPDDYLHWEVEQSIRHEFVDGEVFGMAGADDRHVTIAGNTYMALRQHLRGSPCKTFMSDMKVRIEEFNCFFYPDVMVTCSAKDVENRLVKAEPILVVEVLSDSTAAFDRGGKFLKYRSLKTLQEYVLIDPVGGTTDVYRRGADGLWVLHPFSKDETVEFLSVNFEIQAADLFTEAD